MDSLRSLALELDVPERTMRRAASEGLVRGKREGARKWRMTVGERDYLRRNWGFLSELRSALRTEPNVRLAVLYGSHALGTAGAKSDVDLVVDLRSCDVSRLAELSGRLSDRMSRNVQTVRLSDARKNQTLLADTLRDGRVLIDRENRWWELKREESELDSRSSGDAELEKAIDDLNIEGGGG